MPFPTSAVIGQYGTQGGVIHWPSSARDDDEQCTYVALRQICELFDACPIQQIAFDAVCGEVLRTPLQWVSPGGAVVAGADIISELELAIIGAVRGILVAGSFFWKRAKRRNIPIVPYPTMVWHNTEEYNVGKLFAPYPVLYRKDCINSPAGRAMPASLRLQEHENLLLNRDRINSKPAVFLTVDKRIQNNEALSRPWFRSVGKDFVDTISEEIGESSDLQQLIQDRAEVIQNLGKSTLTTRNVSNPVTGRADAELDASTKYHREHIVTDGYEANNVAGLQSLQDGLPNITKLENRILYAMNVPPVAVGRNVNTERMASSAQLVMHSMRMYATFIERARSAIAVMIKECTIDRKTGHYVNFAIHLDNHDLDRLESILTPKAAADAYASTFRIPREWISETAIEQRQGIMHGEQKTVEGQEAATRQVKRSRGPPPKSKETV